MLWYLQLCVENGVVVHQYVDRPEGTMIESKNGSGYFTEVLLKPQVTKENENLKRKAAALHTQANKMCFIANSCTFDIRHLPEVFTTPLEA